MFIQKYYFAQEFIKHVYVLLEIICTFFLMTHKNVLLSSIAAEAFQQQHYSSFLLSQSILLKKAYSIRKNAGDQNLSLSFLLLSVFHNHHEQYILEFVCSFFDRGRSAHFHLNRLCFNNGPVFR